MQKFLAGSLAVNFVVRSCFTAAAIQDCTDRFLYFCPRDVLTIDFPSIVSVFIGISFFFFPILFAVQGGHFHYVTGDTTMAWTVAPS